MSDKRIADLEAALQAIVKCDENADFGNLCDADNGSQYDCSPGASGELRDALSRARKLLSEHSS